MISSDFSGVLATEIELREAEQDMLTAEIARLQAEQQGIARVLAGLYVTRAAYGEAQTHEAPLSIEDDADGASASVETQSFPEAVQELVDVAIEHGPIAELIAAPSLPPLDLPASPVRAAHVAAVAQMEAKRAADLPSHASRSMLGASWTAEDDGRLIALKRQGEGLDQIAHALGRTVGSVRQRVSKLRGRMNALAATPEAVPDLVEEPVALPAEPERSSVQEPQPVVNLPARRSVEPAAEPARAVALFKAALAEERVKDRPVLSEPQHREGASRQGSAAGSAFTQRSIAAHLDGLPYNNTWTAAEDLQLVEGLFSIGLSATAEAMGLDERHALARWEQLRAPIWHPKTKCDVDGQQLLVAELRRRAGALLQAAS
ncbi:hypothetical protein [Rubellimicrobium arenae]|uniref:hypothetical protein n=1 Tax=Rubellimicrobium arenae TaxID=2817372 RepID=UPI001B3135AA|nr:hypothetical protein [Rubellimicrobium arenae]